MEEEDEEDEEEGNAVRRDMLLLLLLQDFVCVQKTEEEKHWLSVQRSNICNLHNFNPLHNICQTTQSCSNQMQNEIKIKICFSPIPLPS